MRCIIVNSGLQPEIGGRSDPEMQTRAAGQGATRPERVFFLQMGCLIVNAGKQPEVPGRSESEMQIRAAAGQEATTRKNADLSLRN